MSPEKARVFVAEDDLVWQDIIRKRLEAAGHSVVAIATDRHQALALVEQLEELGVDVAVLDGNLNNYEARGHDGQAVLAAIREKAPKVKTIGMSGLSVKGTDVDLGKFNIHKLGEVVKEL